jgi:hypothetical protein
MLDQYINDLPQDRKDAINALRKVIKKNASAGIEEGFQSGMISFHVSYKKYPNGYHCKPPAPLPFIALASQKNFIALYHMGLYASPELLNWFVDAYEKANVGKLDMGKSCIRFKKMESIPVALIGELVSKMGADEWIALYEKLYKK